jgi:lipopolysaccharide transport system ATP-binding protein
MRGSVAALIALGAGFNPILTGRENIYTSASILGMSKDQIDSRLEEIIDFAEISEFIDSPVQTYSSGMQVRLGFSVSVFLMPSIVLLDEVLAVGDIRFRNKCYNALASMRERGASFILVTHDMAAVTRICSKAIYMQRGVIKAQDNVTAVICQYESDSSKTSEIISGSAYNRPIATNISYTGLRVSGEPSQAWKTLSPGEVMLKLLSFTPNQNLTVTYTFSGLAVTGEPVYIVGKCELHMDDFPISSNNFVLFSLSTEQVTLPPGNYFLKIGVWKESFNQIGAAESLQVKVELGNTFIGDSTHIQPLIASPIS